MDHRQQKEIVPMRPERFRGRLPPEHVAQFEKQAVKARALMGSASFGT